MDYLRSCNSDQANYGSCFGLSDNPLARLRIDALRLEENDITRELKPNAYDIIHDYSFYRCGCSKFERPLCPGRSTVNERLLQNDRDPLCLTWGGPEREDGLKKEPPLPEGPGARGGPT
jgi:hypothetical protein